MNTETIIKSSRNNELHLHTDAYYNGMGDGAQTVVQAVDAGIKKGATAIAITDHGNCANWVDFFNYCRGDEVDHQTLGKKGLEPVKPILGVEAYIAKSETLLETEKIMNQHFIILAKDYKGMQAISRFVAETNRHIDEKGRPVGSYEMLNHFFGPESLGYGHVVAMSACIAGVLCNPLMFNIRINKEIGKIQRRIEASGCPDDYFDKLNEVLEIEANVAELDNEIEKLAKMKLDKNEAKAAVQAKIDEIKAAKKDADKASKEELNEAQKNLDAQKKDINDEIKSLNEQTKVIKAKKTELNKNARDFRKEFITPYKKMAETLSGNIDKMCSLENRVKTDEDLIEDAKAVAADYLKIFGENFFAEFQYHHIDEEAQIMPLLKKVAEEMNIPPVITNDVHMANPEDIQARNLVRNVKRIKQQTWSEAIPGDEELYYKSGDEKAEILGEILDADFVEECLKNVEKITDMCNLEKLSESKHYPEFKDADEKLRELATYGKCDVELLDGSKSIHIESPTAGIEARYGKAWSEEHQKRFDYEMSVISKMGFSSYFLFIADVILKCKTARENATDIGPGRGSGAGSIICYNGGITELDPLENNLLFERFLNPERVSMPDIDTDFSKFARQYAINYVTEFYGAKAVAGIMTKGKMGVLSSLTYAPKLLGMERGYGTKAYEQLGKDIRKLVNAKEDKHLSDLDERFEEAFGDNEDAKIIMSYAKMLEGKITSYGQHAAGLISIMDGDIEDYIPLMMAKDAEGNDKLVIQGDMVCAEAQLGFIKFDFLGLKNLNVITACQQAITKHYGRVIDTYNIPLDDAKVYAYIFAAAFTNFVFQFESDGMKGMLKQLNPTCFGDLVLAVSVYRPGPMDFIPDIIRCKNTGAKSPIVERIPMLEETLRETYGFPVYQEQVMRIMTLCAGFTMGHADNVRRFMSKKKEDKLAAERPAFIEGCVKNGIKAEDADWLFDQLMPFAKYGFNKSHAAAYSLVAYITAWLKYYYPAEYLCAAMLEQGDKTLQFISDCKALDLEVLPVSVNDSFVDYNVEKPGFVRIGLSAIKGVGTESEKIVAAREENGTFKSIKSMIERCGLKKDALEAIILAGACDMFTKNRENAAIFAEKCREAIATRKKIDAKLTELIESEADAGKIDEQKAKLAEADKEVNALKLVDSYELRNEKRLAYESALLGMWITGSPLDDYQDMITDKHKSIAETMIGDKLLTIGVVTNFKEIITKKNEKMCIFTLLDKDSEAVKVVVFPKEYAARNFEITDNLVIEIEGEVEEDTRATSENDGEMNDIVKQVVLSTAKSLTSSIKTTFFINLESYSQIKDVLGPLVESYQSTSGSNATVFVEDTKSFIDLNVKMDDKFENALREAQIEFTIK